MSKRSQNSGGHADPIMMYLAFLCYCCTCVGAICKLRSYNYRVHLIFHDQNMCFKIHVKMLRSHFRSLFIATFSQGRCILDKMITLFMRLQRYHILSVDFTNRFLVLRKLMVTLNRLLRVYDEYDVFCHWDSWI